MKYMNFLVLFSFLFTVACNNNVKEKQAVAEDSVEVNVTAEAKLVLAQWTFNKELFAGKMSTFDFINTASDLGFEGVEYVSQFFDDKVNDDAYLAKLKRASEKVDIKNTMILVDVLDSKLGAADAEERRICIEKHKEWIIAASKIDCPNIRVNAHGEGTAEEVAQRVSEAVIELSNFGKKYRVGVNIENHGSHSSNGKWLSTLVGNLMPYGVGSVADFDNWCILRENGVLWGAPCINEYDRYQGIKELLPTARSISLKAFNFNKEGEAIETDFKRMFELIKAAQYDEYLAIEFEGHDMDPIEGVKKTLKLVEKYY